MGSGADTQACGRCRAVRDPRGAATQSTLPCQQSRGSNAGIRTPFSCKLCSPRKTLASQGYELCGFEQGARPAGRQHWTRAGARLSPGSQARGHVTPSRPPCSPAPQTPSPPSHWTHAHLLGVHANNQRDLLLSTPLTQPHRGQITFQRFSGCGASPGEPRLKQRQGQPSRPEDCQQNRTLSRNLLRKLLREMSLAVSRHTANSRGDDRDLREKLCCVPSQERWVVPLPRVRLHGNTTCHRALRS